MHKIIISMLLFAGLLAAQCQDASNFGYDWMIPLTVDSTYVQGTTDLVDYPIGVWRTGVTWLKDFPIGYTKESGQDVIFKTEAGVDLTYEFVPESFDGTAGNGEFHILDPSLEYASDTVVCAYVGKSGGVSLSNPSGTFPGYAAVYHFGQDPSGPAPQLFDSVNEIENMTCLGMAASDLIDDELGKAIQAPVSTKYCQTDSTTFMNGHPVGSVSFLFKPLSAWGAWTEIFSDAIEGIQDGLIIRTVADTDKVGYEIFGFSGGVASPAAQSLAWHHIAMTWESDLTRVSEIAGFLDGANVGINNTNLTTAGWTNSVNTTLFTRPGNVAGRHQPGVFSELRVRFTVVTGFWNSTEYNNFNLPDLFIVDGTPVPAAPTTGVKVRVGGIVGQ